MKLISKNCCWTHYSRKNLREIRLEGADETLWLRGTTNEHGNEISLSVTCCKVTEQILIFHNGYSPWSW